MTLPSACDECQPYGGNWRENPKGGMERCVCSRGAALKSANQPKPALDPVISPTHAGLCAQMMGAIPFFPGSAGALTAIANEIASMCHTPEEAVWLAQRMVRLYRKWPGVQEMRLVFCQRYRPLDAIEASADSDVYPDGIPSETQDSLALAAPPQQRRIAGGTTEPASAAQSIVATLSDLVRAKDMNRTLRGMTPPKVRDIPVRQITDENRITPEQIAEAERKLHTAQAKAQVAK